MVSDNKSNGEICMKPLSKKTLDKKYAELGLPAAKVDLLHTYFRCFANLYGVITVHDAWEVFKHYEGSNTVRRKDFYAFSGIVQREAGNPFSVFELKEIYGGEESEKPENRLVVNNKLVLSGYNRFIQIYATVERQGNKPWFMPEKEVFLCFSEAQFYLTAVGKQMRQMIEGLRTSGIGKNHKGEPTTELLDIDGNPVAGNRLADFVFYTSDEQFEIAYVKSEAKRQQLRNEYRTSAAEKVLERIEMYLMTGGVFRDENMAQELEFLVNSLDRDFGVSLSQSQLMQFTELFMDLNNNSNLWLNCGWKPTELCKVSGSSLPSAISIGPNMKQMFRSGELDQKEFEQTLAKMGIKLIN